MKYLKSYEIAICSFNRNNRPKNGDYVLIKCVTFISSIEDSIFQNFINNNIGKIIDTHSIFIHVKYENIPKSILDRFSKFSDAKSCPRDYYSFQYDNVICYSNNKEDLIPYLTANKYNL